MSMNSGLLWYDPDPGKSTTVKVAEAVGRYKERFGHTPNACYVCPSFAQVASEKESVRSLGITCLSSRWIKPGYFWIGVDEEAVASSPRKARTRRLPTETREPARAIRSLMPVA